MNNRHRKSAGERSLRPIILFSLACLFCILLPFSLRPQSVLPTPTLLPGQSATVLSDGNWLLVGGEGAKGSLSTFSIWNPRTGFTTELAVKLHEARAWHTATVLPDGTILIFGGVGSNGQVISSAEIFDPDSQRLLTLAPTGLTGRSRHTASLMTDGHVLVVGGVDVNKGTLSSAEIWSYQDGTVVGTFQLATPRRSHFAKLMTDGSVLIEGGANSNGDPLYDGELFDPATKRFTVLDPATLNGIIPPPLPVLVDSLPADNSVDVPTDALLSFRFSKPLRTETVNKSTVTLSGPDGIEPIRVVAAEGGMLAFVHPDSGLLPGARYTVTFNGPVDQNGLLLPLSGISFSTKSLATAGPTASSSGSGLQSIGQTTSSRSPTDDDWTWTGQLKDGKPHSPSQDLPALQGAPGVTALAGQVLDLKGEPLANVTLEIAALDYGKSKKKVKTDETGRFLIERIEEGWSELLIDGRVGHNPGSGVDNPNWGYGIFEYGLEIEESSTNVLPFTIWLPRIDSQNVVKTSSPTVSEVIATTPRIPGLELRIPQGTTIYDHEGKTVDEINLTPIPVDRTPFPLPKGIEVPIYFTAQPGGAYLKTSGPIGARVYYPNNRNELPGSRFQFWHYDPKYKGWYVYGIGSVPEDGKQVIPDPGISVHEFTGAMVFFPTNAPAEGPVPCCDGGKGGDPVDLYTGLFEHTNIDLSLPDVLPINLTRTYRTRDTVSRAFGIGANHPYEMFLVGDRNPYTYIELILPDGGRIHYDRTSPGTGFSDAAYEHVSTPTRFYKSTINWNGNGWDLKLKDGSMYIFGNDAPLQAIRDRYGNQITIYRTSGQSGNITRILSPNGRWIDFTYGAGNRIAQATDNIGRTVSYTYDTTGRLDQVTDANGGITEYTYDSLQRIVSVKNARGFTVVRNEYNAAGKVIKQTLADEGTYTFAYTLDGNGKTIQAEVTDPRNTVRRLTFNSTGYSLTETHAVGTPEERLTTYIRESGSSLRQSVTDALNRKTAYTYDSQGNLLTATRLADTPDAVTTTYTYEPTFNQVATVTDPLNHTTTFDYNSQGNLTTVTDALSHQTTYTYNQQGQPLTITTPAGTSQFGYEFGDVVTITDPMGNTTTRFLDAAGRLLNAVDPLGRRSLYGYDALNRLTSVTDPFNGLTEFGYDANGNLLSVTDAQNHVTTYSYDNRDRLSIRTDPLGKGESYGYDDNGNPTQFVDRKGQSVTTTYDALNRRTQLTYADGSTTNYTYDLGNRLTQINDSVSGPITRTYDGLDRLTSEQTPQGTVGYTYDAANRRATMTVAGQPSVVYSYDNANRLIQITQGSSIVQFGYDNADRRTSLTLPNGILVEYAYDAASRVTAITYKQNGTTVLGDLTYEYDKAGNRTKIGGSWARSGIPDNVNTTSYDAGNRQMTFGDKTLTYDDNGNLTSITDANGTTLYSWNARNQLASIAGPNATASFVYDGVGRREKKTINGSLTEFLYDGVNPVQETSGATILANILPSLDMDEFLTRTDVGAGTNSSFLTDALGSPIAVTDNAGIVQTEYTYEAFGRTTAIGVSNSSSYQYTGRENDGTDLFYYRNRYYHPELSRFISEDPIEFEGGDVNLFAYVGNDPINHVDQLGLFLDGALSQALEGAITGSRAGPIGAAIGIIVGTVLSPKELGNPDREIIRPNKKPGKWVCGCRADCDDTKPGNCPKDPKQQFKFGTWSDPVFHVAFTEAKRLAVERLGCKPKHVQCKCIGPNGEIWP